MKKLRMLLFFFLFILLYNSSALTAELNGATCEVSDTRSVVIIDECVTGIANTALESNCTLSDRIMQCADNAKNHGEFVSCTAHLTNDLMKRGILTGTEKGKIQSCAATADLPFTNHPGTYCLVMEEPDSIFSTEIIFEQSGSFVTANLYGITMTGTISDHTMNLTAELPEEGTVAVALVFSDDFATFDGTFSEGDDVRPITGTQGACTDYIYPAGDPACILPIEDVSLVTGGQRYNSEYAGVRHSGIDFRIDTTLSDIVAPCDGVITQISRHPIAFGNIIVDIGIKYNDTWSTFIAFEPYSPDEEIADQQSAEIAVSVNQIVHQGDLLGRLVVPGTTEFPHIHWGVNQGSIDVCPRDYLLPADQVQLDSLYTALGLYPPCLP